MPVLYPCSHCGQLFQRIGKGTRCTTCAPYGWPATRPMSSDWTRIRRQKLEANPRCESCGARATTVDHILARAFGGKDDWANLRSLCKRCAGRKDHLDRERGKGGRGPREG